MLLDSDGKLSACRPDSLLTCDFTTQEFLRPIVTPFELELALTSKSWTGDYILDFTALLSSTTFGQTHVDPSLRAAGDASDDDEGDEDRPIYSSTTGKYRHPKRYTKSGVNGERNHFPSRDTVSLPCSLRSGLYNLRFIQLLQFQSH